MNLFDTIRRGLNRFKLLLLLAVAGFGSYTYYVTDGSAWTTNGSYPLNYSNISTQAVPDGSSDYEVRTVYHIGPSTACWTGSVGESTVHYLRATNDAYHSSSTTTGSYYAAVLTVTTNSNCIRAGTLSLYKRVSGVVTLLSSTNVGLTVDSEIRSAITADGTILVYINGTRYLKVQDTSLTTGKPGYGDFGGVTGVYVATAQLGALDRIAPQPVVASSVSMKPLDYSLELQWAGTGDDANGVGVFAYRITRNGTYVAEVQGNAFTDLAVNPSVTYSYTITAVDRHNNSSTPITLSATTAYWGAIDSRRVGLPSTGTFWGGAGEQLDMRSGNLNFSVPLLGVKGRGFGFGLGLVYNSQNWMRDGGNTIWRYGRDVGYGFGWRLILGSLLPVYSDNLTVHHYVLSDSSGAEYRLDVNNSGVWTSSQGTYATYVEATNRIYFNNGSYWQMDALSGGTEDDAGTRYPTKLQDTNGNYVAIRYMAGLNAPVVNTSARISQIEDVRPLRMAEPLTRSLTIPTRFRI